MNLSTRFAEKNEQFALKARTRRVVSSVSDVIEVLFSEVHETSKITSKTTSTHDVNIGRCEASWKSIGHVTRPPRISPNTASSTPKSALSAIAAVATAAAIRTSSFDGNRRQSESDSVAQQRRPSSSSWEASAAEAELSADLLALSVAATTLADRVRKFTQGHRDPLTPMLDEEQQQQQEFVVKAEEAPAEMVPAEEEVVPAEAEAEAEVAPAEAEVATAEEEPVAEEAPAPEEAPADALAV